MAPSEEDLHELLVAYVRTIPDVSIIHHGQAPHSGAHSIHFHADPEGLAAVCRRSRKANTSVCVYLDGFEELSYHLMLTNDNYTVNAFIGRNEEI